MRKIHRVIGALTSKPARLVLTSAILFIAAAAGHAQGFTLLHSFSGAGDGAAPVAGLTIDRAGNFYGVASDGGNGCNCGTAFRLAHRGSGWTLTPIYTFLGGSDGRDPQSNLVFGPNGSLYGTTNEGGQGNCSLGLRCGTVFNLRPPATIPSSVLAPWTETVLYRFAGGADGDSPGTAGLVFDAAGNIFGTTQTGGSSNVGTVYELSPNGGGFVKTTLLNFDGMAGGGNPISGVVIDAAGNLYGTTSAGGAHGQGTVYQLTRSGSGWAETVLHDFNGGSDGAIPEGNLLLDPAGNIFGTTTGGGDGSAGVVFELTRSGSGWDYSVIQDFLRADAAQPVDRLTMDAAGNLYGTAISGGANNLGAAFRLTHSDGGWTFHSLRSFSGSDGSAPFSSVALDANGNVFGTTSAGGTNLQGVVFEITP